MQTIPQDIIHRIINTLPSSTSSPKYKKMSQLVSRQFCADTNRSIQLDKQQWHLFKQSICSFRSPCVFNTIYSPNNGTQKWAFQSGGWINSSPAIGPDGTIYVGSNDNNLYAIY